MSDLPDGWKEVNPPERFDSRTFLTTATYADAEFSRGYVAYYTDRHSIEASLDGETEFSYHDTEAEAMETARESMQRMNNTIDNTDAPAFYPGGGADE